MEGTEEEGVIAESKAITTVEVDGSSYVVVDWNAGKGDRRSDGRKTADFFVVEEGERAKKQRALYDPSHGRVGLKSKVGKSDLEDDNLIQLNEDSTTTTENAGENKVGYRTC
jgi:hypothetical protein